MALEEVAAESVADGGTALVRVFRWEPSTLSMGYGQHEETVDWEYCEAAGIDVTRRQTGGGGIYHDHVADISYSIVVPADAVAGDLITAYHTLCEPILDFLAGIDVEAAFADEPQPAIYEPACFLRDIHPAHDILVDGRKISGNAQYRQQDAVIQHGSILFDRAAEPHVGVFDSATPTVNDLDQRTTTITEHVALDRDAVVGALTESLAEWADAVVADWTSSELDEAAELATAKYAADEWVRGSSGSSPPGPGGVE